MDWQLIGVAVAVLGAMCYIGRASWKAWLGKPAGCASGCGKCTAVETAEPGRKIRLL